MPRHVCHDYHSIPILYFVTVLVHHILIGFCSNRPLDGYFGLVIKPSYLTRVFSHNKYRAIYATSTEVESYIDSKFSIHALQWILKHQLCYKLSWGKFSNNS